MFIEGSHSERPRDTEMSTTYSAFKPFTVSRLLLKAYRMYSIRNSQVEEK